MQKQIFIIISILLLITTCAHAPGSKAGNNRLLAEYIQAFKLIEKEEYDSAIFKLKRIIETESSFYRAYITLVNVYFSNGVPDEAISYFAELDSMYGRWALGLVYGRKELFEKAIESYKSAIALGPSFSLPYTDFVNAYVRWDKKKGAAEVEAYYKDRIERDPSDAYAYYGLGYLYHTQNQWDDGLAMLDKAIELDPLLVSAWHSKAAIYLYTGQTGKALELWDHEILLARETDPYYIFVEGIVYNNIAYAYGLLSDNSTAMEYYEKALAIVEKTKNRKIGMMTRKNLGIMYLNLADYPKALEYTSLALSIAEELDDKKHMANSLNNLGIISLKLSDYPMSLEYFKKAVAIHKDLGNKKFEGGTLANIGNIYEALSDYPTALEYLKKAMIIMKETGNIRHEGLVLNNIGNIYYALSDYRLALEHYESALSIHRKLGARMIEGKILDHIGVIYLNLSDYPRALEYCMEALSIHEKMGNKRDEAIALSNLASIYEALADFNESLEFRKKALSIFREIGDKRNEVVALNNLGSIYKYQSDYARALEYLEEGLAVNREVGNKQIVGVIYNNIGSVYEIFTDYTRALDYFKKALTINVELGDKTNQALALGNIGNIYNYNEEYAGALEYFSKSLAIHKETGSRKNVGVNLGNIGSVYEAMEDYPKALDYYRQAIVIHREIGNLRGEGITLNNTGVVYKDLEEYEKALEYSRKSLDIHREIGDKINERRALANIADVYYYQSDYSKAFSTYQAAIKIIESARGTLKNEGHKTSFLQKKIDLYNSTVSLLYDMHEDNPTGNYDIAAFTYAEKSKARGLLDLLEEANTNIRQGIDPELYGQLQELEKEYSRINTFLFKELSKSGGFFDKKKVEGFQESLGSINEKYEQLKLSITQRNPKYAELNYPEPVTVEMVQADLLDEYTVLLEYKITNNHLFVWQITKDSFKVFRIPLEKGQLDQLVSSLRNSITYQAREEFFVKKAHDLYTLILEPVIKDIKDKKDKNNLLIIPDGILNYLPFGVLISGNPGGAESTYETLPYLLKSYFIRYAPSASVALRTRKLKNRSRTSERKDLFAMGDTFLRDENGLADNFFIRSMQDETTRYRRLIHSGDEVKSIGRLFRNPDIYLREAAKEELLKPPNRLNNYRYIHLAAHGMFNEKNPGGTGIILSQDDDPAEDGFLQMREIFNLEIQADLVVLSACWSGLGKIVKGEGIIGFTRAWMYAGTPSIIASLWQIDDLSTRYLMEDFYKNIRVGKNYGDALRKAKLKLIRMTTTKTVGGEEIEIAYSNPYYWAGFVLTGSD